MSKNLCLEAQHKGKRTIFTERQRLLKCPKRPELRDSSFINGRLKQCIETPHLIFQDLMLPDKRRACYLEEYTTNNYKRYTKVVLEERKNYFFVITAYRPNYIKEKGKTTLLYDRSKRKNF